MDIFTDEALNCLLFAKIAEEEKKAISLIRRKVTEGMLQRTQALEKIRKELGE